MSIDVRYLGLVPYETAWKLQQTLLIDRIQESVDDTLLVVEHPAVITLGRKFPGALQLQEEKKDNWEGLPLYIVERGGEATYHGPGQIVLYPIFRLSLTIGPKKFLRLLENAIIATLVELEIDGFTREGITGVWVNDAIGEARKIASLGIAVRHSVTYHGLALNFNCDLNNFRKINPCGLSPQVMTSVRDLVGKEPRWSFYDTARILVAKVCAAFTEISALPVEQQKENQIEF